MWNIKYLFRVYLGQRAVELMNGVHHIQQHVVADHKFTLCNRNGKEFDLEQRRPRLSSIGYEKANSQIWRWRV